jgi:energy-coupling factor transport system ATP-binding protein
MTVRYIWGASGSGLSEHAWAAAEASGAAWVGNDAAAHITLLRPTVREELAFGMEQQGIPREVMASRIDDAVDLWGLREIIDRDPSRLSTGQTRRVAVAAALLRDPGALVLDCPTDGLDAAAVDTLVETLSRFSAEVGDVTVYDRVATPLASLAGQHFHLVDGALTPAPAPGPELPEMTPATAGEPVLDAGFTATNGSFTLDVSLVARAGQVTHLAGPNGSGKTTLMLAVLGLLPHTGRLVAPSSPTPGWAPTGMDAAFSKRSVFRELMVGTDRAHARAALEWVGLEQWADVHPLDVPSAARRMVAVAAALVRGPELLLVDEPTVGLDASGHAWLARVLRGYAAG